MLPRSRLLLKCINGGNASKNDLLGYLTTCKTINYESPQCQKNALPNLECKLETNKAICGV